MKMNEDTLRLLAAAKPMRRTREDLALETLVEQETKQERFKFNFLGYTKKDDWQCYAWEVTGTGDFKLLYHVGIGHAVQTRYCLEVPVPSTLDVLNCIRLDDTKGMSFEQWASEFCYDTDSRKAEKLWHACRDQTDMYRRNYNFDVHSYARLDDY